MTDDPSTRPASGSTPVPTSDGSGTSRDPAVATGKWFVDAVSIAARAFEHHRRDGTDELYLTHALDVAQALGPAATVRELCAAVLHDILEDTDWTPEDLLHAGVDAQVLEVVETLTRRPAEEDEEFVARICATPGRVGVTAQRVKLADLTVNLANAGSEGERERFQRSIPLVRAAVERSS